MGKLGATWIGPIICGTKRPNIGDLPKRLKTDPYNKSFSTWQRFVRRQPITSRIVCQAGNPKGIVAKSFRPLVRLAPNEESGLLGGEAGSGGRLGALTAPAGTFSAASHKTSTLRL